MDVQFIGAVGFLCCHHLTLLDLPSLSTVSRSWFASTQTCMSRLKILNTADCRGALQLQLLNAHKVSKDSVASKNQVASCTKQDANVWTFFIHWVLPRTPTLLRLELGSALPYGWILPDTLLPAIARCCRLLVHLELRGMCLVRCSVDRRRTEQVLIAAPSHVAVLKNIPSLQYLDVVFCPQIDRHVLHMMAACCPGVRVQRLPNWFSRQPHVCMGHPGVKEAWFRCGEMHTYNAEGNFRFDPRETFTQGMVNRCWPLDGTSSCDTGLIIELQFAPDRENQQEYLPVQVRIEKNSALALAFSADACDSDSLYFTSAHSNFQTQAPFHTPTENNDDISVGVWKIDYHMSFIT